MKKQKTYFCPICEKWFFKINSTQQTCWKGVCNLALNKIKRDEKAKVLSIRIWGMPDDTKRKSLRGRLETLMPEFIDNKTITIKIKPWRIKTDLKKLEEKADKLWALYIRSIWYCEYCWTDENLHAHHIYSRAKKSTRWHPKNWICLCANHHNWSSEFSAHKNPAKFRAWLILKKWKEVMQSIYLASCEITKITDELLKERIEFYWKNTRK